MTKTTCLKVNPAELRKLDEQCGERMQIPTYGLGSFRDFDVKFDNGHSATVSLQNSEKGVFVDLALAAPDGNIVQLNAHQRLESVSAGFTIRYAYNLYKIEVVELPEVGSRVRAFDNVGNDGSYVEGLIESIGKPPHNVVPDTVNDYCFIRCARRVVNGVDVPSAGKLFRWPQNGSSLGVLTGGRLFSHSIITVG